MERLRHFEMAVACFALVGCARSPEHGSGHATQGARASASAPQLQDTAKSAKSAADPVFEPEKKGPPPSNVRETTKYQADRSMAGAQKNALATDLRTATVKGLFDSAGVEFPPSQLYLRVFKNDRELEVWSGSQGHPMKLIATYRICAMSGTVGPKRAEGDGQVPEGFYRLSYFWPDELFHLAAKVDYPNAVDKARGYGGGDIMIHGGCASIGCIAMGDERIEELWVMGEPLRRKGVPIPITIFPARDMAGLLDNSELAAMHDEWRVLGAALARFEQTRRPPVLVGTAKGLRIE